jgi:hypothetical protein
MSEVFKNSYDIGVNIRIYRYWVSEARYRSLTRIQMSCCLRVNPRVTIYHTIARIIHMITHLSHPNWTRSPEAEWAGRNY